jgi:hypothetical protein
VTDVPYTLQLHGRVNCPEAVSQGVMVSQCTCPHHRFVQQIHLATTHGSGRVLGQLKSLKSNHLIPRQPREPRRDPVE